MYYVRYSANAQGVQGVFYIAENLDPELVTLRLAPSWGSRVKAHKLQKFGFASEYICTTNTVPCRDINLALREYKHPTGLISIK